MTIEIGDKLNGDSASYLVEAPIAEGGFGVTYQARREADGLTVVVKTLRLDRMKQWKSLELFEREVAVLRQLDHPNIPDYIDSFTLGTPQEPRGWALVQELVSGRDLRQLMRDDARLDEPAMLSWFRQILEVLDYLHRLAPPVIDRDVNPKNIILADDGRAFLVDFGTVQAAIQSQDSVASTAAGTFGYAPFEQFMGRAAPASDLYGLAMTYLAVSTGQEPEELPLDGNQVDVRKALSRSRGGCDARLLLLLERMAIADAEKRLSSAAEALERLTPLVAPAAPRTADPAAARSADPAAAAAPAPELPAPPAPHAAPDLRSPAVWQEAALYNAEHDRQAIWPMPVNLPTQALRRFGLARDGSRLFVADYTEGWEIQLDTLRARTIRVSSAGEDFICSGSDGGARFSAVSPDGSQLAVGDRDGKLRVGPLEAGKKGATRFEVPGLAGLDFSPNGYFLVCVHSPETLLLGRQGERVSVQARCLQYHPGGRRVVLGRGGRLLVGSARALEKGLGWRPAELPLEGEIQQLRFNHDDSCSPCSTAAPRCRGSAFIPSPMASCPARRCAASSSPRPGMRRRGCSASPGTPGW